MLFYTNEINVHCNYFTKKETFLRFSDAIFRSYFPEQKRKRTKNENRVVWTHQKHESLFTISSNRLVRKRIVLFYGSSFSFVFQTTLPEFSQPSQRLSALPDHSTRCPCISIPSAAWVFRALPELVPRYILENHFFNSFNRIIFISIIKLLTEINNTSNRM